MSTPTDPRLGWTSASNAQADRLCPGRHQAQKGLPEIQTDWSEFGKHVHDALAYNVDRAELGRLTAEERDMFDSHREVEKQLIAKIWPDFVPDTSQATRVFRHERLWCKVPSHDDWQQKAGEFYQHSGEADFIMLRSDKVLIQDYKSLAGDVPESPRNEQLRDLAVMAWRTLNPEEVLVAINQPLVTWTPEICRYTKEDLERAEKEMWDRVRKSNQLNAPRVAGGLQCKFCKAANVCKEHAVWRASLAPTPSPLTVAMNEWTLEQRSLVADHLPRLRKLLDDAEKFLKAKLKEDPNAVPGFYLKDGDVRHPINNPQELFNRFSTLGGQLEQFMKCIKVTKEELETQVRVVTKTKGKSLKAEMEKLLAGITEAKQNAPSLARRDE